MHIQGSSAHRHRVVRFYQTGTFLRCTKYCAPCDRFCAHRDFLSAALPARLLAALPRACSALAHQHTRPRRIRHARSTRARLAGDAHALTRQHTLARQTLDVMLEALTTGWPSAGWQLAHLARARCANASPPPLIARPMRHPHTAPAIEHRCCQRVLRDHDDERDGDERNHEEDREHDGRRERVRAARVCGSHAPNRTRKHAVCKHLVTPSTLRREKARTGPSPHSTCCSSDRHCARHTTR